MNDFSEFRPFLVAIVGPSGGGKSWLARELRLRLGKESDGLALDSYYRDRSHLPSGRRSRVNFDHPRAIDWPLVESALDRAKKGKAFPVPTYDFAEHVRRAIEWRRPCPILVAEGLWLLWRPSVRRCFAFSIFIRCASRTCLQRRLERDMAERGREAASVRRQFREQVAPMARRYILPQERLADLVVRSPLSAEDVDRIATRLRMQIGERREE
jgi:uridine kinase